ncbi:MAG TPA: hypothetical protein VLA19_33025 [Herpetosiphonaceae bacterium]|nr:hypothetical protein [Herpetosiphonaceae bacterium]
MALRSHDTTQDVAAESAALVPLEIVERAVDVFCRAIPLRRATFARLEGDDVETPVVVVDPHGRPDVARSLDRERPQGRVHLQWLYIGGWVVADIFDTGPAGRYGVRFNLERDRKVLEAIVRSGRIGLATPGKHGAWMLLRGEQPQLQLILDEYPSQQPQRKAQARAVAS